jgi:hypothetical protein
MVFYFLISIVFIAEVIIALFVITSLVKLDKILNSANIFFDEVKPKIKDIMQIVRKLSEQMIELAPIVRGKIKSVINKMVVDQLKSLLTGLTFWLVKTEVEKRI